METKGQSGDDVLEYNYIFWIRTKPLKFNIASNAFKISSRVDIKYISVNVSPEQRSLRMEETSFAQNVTQDSKSTNKHCNYLNNLNRSPYEYEVYML